MNVVTKTDHILERLSQSKRTRGIVFLLAFLEQSFSPILPEAYLALILSYRKDISWKVLSLFSALGSLFGAALTYLLGYFFFASYGERIVTFLGWNDIVISAKNLFGETVFVTQLVAALTPLPDRIFAFTAGAFEVFLPAILLATFLGRLLRASVVAYVAYEWGDEARDFIKKHTKLASIALLFLFGIYIGYTLLQ